MKDVKTFLLVVVITLLLVVLHFNIGMGRESINKLSDEPRRNIFLEINKKRYSVGVDPIDFQPGLCPLAEFTLTRDSEKEAGESANVYNENSNSQYSHMIIISNTSSNPILDDKVLVNFLHEGCIASRNGRSVMVFGVLEGR